MKKTGIYINKVIIITENFQFLETPPHVEGLWPKIFTSGGGQFFYIPKTGIASRFHGCAGQACRPAGSAVAGRQSTAENGVFRRPLADFDPGHFERPSRPGYEGEKNCAK